MVFIWCDRGFFPIKAFRLVKQAAKTSTGWKKRTCCVFNRSAMISCEKRNLSLENQFHDEKVATKKYLNLSIKETFYLLHLSVQSRSRSQESGRNPVACFVCLGYFMVFLPFSSLLLRLVGLKQHPVNRLQRGCMISADVSYTCITPVLRRQTFRRAPFSRETMRLLYLRRRPTLVTLQSTCEVRPFNSYVRCLR